MDSPFDHTYVPACTGEKGYRELFMITQGFYWGKIPKIYRPINTISGHGKVAAKDK